MFYNIYSINKFLNIFDKKYNDCPEYIENFY